MTRFFDPPQKKPPNPRKGKPVGVRNPNSASSKKIALKTEKNLTTKQQAMADEFVLQYLRDFKPKAAYIRAQNHMNPFDEIADSTAMVNGNAMLRWPYVQKKLHDAMQDAEEKNIVTRNEVLFGLKREANYYGVGASHGARITGWSQLAKIMGMETKKVEATLAMKGGVMIVPPVEGLDSWELRAAAAQANLKEAVRG